MVLAFPNVYSPKSIVAKLTPYGFHRWIYRAIFGADKLGSSGYEPFPTYLKFSISSSNITKVCKEHGFSLVYSDSSETALQAKLRMRIGIVGWKWRTVQVLVKIFSLGILDISKTDFTMIFRKCPNVE